LVSYSGKKLVIEVKDNGPGFSENEMKKVFKKFFRVDENKTGGLGLGLSIAKGFVEAHGGNISIANQECGGARFIIQIPTDIPDMKNLQQQDDERK
jgi:signal transduction histidine kinase